MNFRSPKILSSSKVWTCFALVILSIFHFWLRKSAISLPYFHNEDTAGITYSADLILRGGLPLVDTVEMKAPGSFFLLAGWWSMVGRSLENAQLLAVIWSYLATLGIGVGTWVLYRSTWATLFSMLMYISLAPFTDSIDINYGAWMITPYIWSACGLWWVIRQRSLSEKETDHHWLIIGCLIATAALMKRQGAALFPLALFIIYWGPRRGKQLGKLSTGLAFMFGLFFSYYALKGHLFEGVSHYFLSRSGWAYLASSVVSSSHDMISTPPKLPRLWDGLYGLPYHLPISFLFAIFSQLVAWRSDQEPVQHSPSQTSISKASLLWIFVGLSFCGTALGLRFFKGYYLQLLPGLIWLSVNPSSWLKVLTLLQRLKGMKIKGNRMMLCITLCGVICLPFALKQSWLHLNKTLKMRSSALYLPTIQVYQISEYINLTKDQQNEKPNQDSLSLWVWGRWAWPAYFYTQAHSPTRYFKNLGVLTTQLSNTWNPSRKSTPTQFDPHSPWRQAINELNAHPPQWILVAKNESKGHFKALNLFLQSRYQSVSYQHMKMTTNKRRQLFQVYRLK
jgi:hypothetical protein